MEENFKEILIYQLKGAYRKYKNHIYYDNYSSIQRFNLAEFEFKNFGKNFSEKFNDNDFHENFDNFFLDFAEKLCDDFDSISDKIINEINVISIPKHFIDENNDNNIISNFNIMNKKLNKVHYFIDLPVEGHILGVLWIIRCGFLLDDKLYSHCYGNRLNETFLEKIKNNQYDDFSPFLFKPYYKNYQSWRDNGLNSVNTILENDKNAIMFSLDFKDYYYRSLINFDDLKNDLITTKKVVFQMDDNNLNDFDDKLTNFIESIFNEYSKKFCRDISNTPLTRVKSYENGNFKDLPMIPLGFLPSLIISNWNLQGFDKSILEEVHPFYYGRYVDDILIVLESHEKSPSFGKSPVEELSLPNFLNKYFTPNSENPFNHILHVNPNLDDKDYSKSVIRVYNLPINTNNHSNEIKYYHYENLEIQMKKLRVYKFSNKCSDAIIKNFKKEIYKNSSEFRLMHSLDDIKDCLEDNLYKINYKESINRLNDINDVSINKYEISKILSRLNFASKNLFNEKIPNDMINEVKFAFQGKYIDFLSLWEKLFSFLYINDCFDEINLLLSQIINDINSIEFCLGLNDLKQFGFSKWQWDDSYKFTLYSDNLNKNYDFNTDLELQNLKKSLLNFLYASVIRVVSLKSNFNKINLDFFKNICSLYDRNPSEHVYNYLFSLMHNNSLMKYPLKDVWHFNEDYDFIHQKNGKNNLYSGIYPRFIKLNEFIFHKINNNIFSEEITPDMCNIELNYIKNFIEQYNEHNFGIKSDKLNSNSIDNWCINNEEYKLNDLCTILNIYSHKKDKIKIGLLNTKLFEENVEKRLKNKPNLSFKRFDNIKYLMNDAIKKGVELLVMPEMYIPYEWINEIVRVSKDHQMAIIFGVEPIVNKNNVGNYIMYSLPFLINNKYHESVVIHRLKNHYAPFELKTYKKYNKTPIEINNNYHLLIWNDVYIAPYYCFEIADIEDRSLFKNCCDIVTVSEFNKDTQYFRNIAESLSRDLFCYCIKSNTSEFGGSVIIQPSSSENKYLVNLKGGENDYIITYNLDIKKLREESIKNDNYLVNSYFKPKPPGFDIEIIKKRMGLGE